MATSGDSWALRELPKLVGTVLGPTHAVLLSQERIDAFARVTEDFQWIHTDPVRAALGHYGGTVAHGFLTLALRSRFFNELIHVRDAPAAVNYGLDQVRFPAPVPAGAAVRATVEVLGLRAEQRGVLLTTQVVMTADSGPKPACVATCVTLYPGGELA